MIIINYLDGQLKQVLMLLYQGMERIGLLLKKILMQRREEEVILIHKLMSYAKL